METPANASCNPAADGDPLRRAVTPTGPDRMAASLEADLQADLAADRAADGRARRIRAEMEAEAIRADPDAPG